MSKLRLAAASVLIVATGSFFWSCASTPAIAATGPAHPIVLKIENANGGWGSGVVVADDWVLTCRHVLPAVRAGDFDVKHQVPHLTKDLALLLVPGVKANGLRIAGEPAELHQDLFAYGWHLGDHFVKTRGFQGLNPELMSAPVIHGCSGGAVTDARGQLLGIITWVVYTGTANGWDGYALPHVSGYTPLGQKELDWISDMQQLHD